MRRAPALALATALVLGAPPLAAQGACAVGSSGGSCVLSDQAAYVSMIGTPAAAVTPVRSMAMLELPGTSPAIGVRYGNVSSGGATSHNFGADLILPLSPRGSVDMLAGYVSPDCTGCEGFLMIGAALEGRLVSSPLGPGPDAPTLTMGVGWQLGYARPSGGHYLSVVGSVPVAIVMGVGSAKIAPFLQPALGYGRVNAGGISDGGTRPLLGGGVAIANRAGTVAVDVGFQHVFVRGRKSSLGVGLVVGTGP